MENKRNCSECGQKSCKVVVSDRSPAIVQKEMVRACQNKWHKPIKRDGFSVLELALRKSGTAVNDILQAAKLQFVINDDIRRGFDLIRL